MSKRCLLVFVSVLLLAMTVLIQAQSEFAATLEVLSSGVEVQRVNTASFITVEIEAIVGVGDIIRTDETGEARITFFADGSDVTLAANTEYQIIEFQGDDEDFQLSVEVLAGQATHRLNRALGANSSYDVETPSMTLAAQGTVFAVRVEDSGRSGMLVFEGMVDAGNEGESADVPAEFGIRAEVDSDLSDVVRATTFAELDAALDGCSATVTTIDDVSINVRSGPSLDQTQIGVILAADIDLFLGRNEDGIWYRIAFNDGFGWILSSTAVIDRACAGLRVFEDSFSENSNSADSPAPESTAEANES